MFNNYSGIINLNQVLKDKYNYNDSNNLQDLATHSFIEIEGEGKDALCWITYNNDKYLFKPLENPNKNLWGEILSQEMAKILNIPCAEYRIATLNNQKGVITKSFLEKGQTLVLGSEIYQEFLNKIHYQKEKAIKYKKESLPKIENKNQLFNYLNNIQSTLFILKESIQMKEKEYYNLENHFIKLLLFDIITLQEDRHANNWGMIKINKEYKPSPLYDNSSSFGLGSPFLERKIEIFQSEKMNAKLFHDSTRINNLLYHSSPNFTLSKENIIDINSRKKDIAPKVLLDLLKYTKEETRNWIISTIYTLKEIPIQSILEASEKKVGIAIDKNLAYYISDIYELNLENLIEVIEFYRKEGNKNAVPKSFKSI